MLPGKLGATLAAFAGALLVTALAVTWTPPTSAATTNVTIQNFAYSPGDLTVTAGDSVTWTNRDPDFNTGGNGHTATSDTPGVFDTGQLRHNESSQPITFTAYGDFPYHCSVHPNMTGMLRVTPPPGVTTTTTLRPTTTLPPPTTRTTRPPPTTRVTTTTTTMPPTTTTERPRPTTTEPPATTTTSTTTTTMPPTTTTERLDLSSGPRRDDDDGGGGFVGPLLLGFLVVIGGAGAAAVIVTRLRGGSG
jgi:plastocyanin